MEKKNGNCTEKNENKHQGFFYFYCRYVLYMCVIYHICVIFDIKHTNTLTKHGTTTDKFDIKHTLTPTKYGLADSILSQPDIIQVHQQKIKH